MPLQFSCRHQTVEAIVVLPLRPSVSRSTQVAARQPTGHPLQSGKAPMGRPAAWLRLWKLMAYRTQLFFLQSLAIFVAAGGNSLPTTREILAMPLRSAHLEQPSQAHVCGAGGLWFDAR